MRNTQQKTRPQELSDTCLRTLTETELVGAAQSGCTDSFAELVRRNSERLLRFLARRTGDTRDTEDLVQETFVRAYQNLGSYRNVSRFSTWLCTIAMRLAVSRYRRKSLSVEPIGPELAADQPGPHEVAARREQADALWRMAATLPACQYQVLQLRYAADLTINEIAEVLHKTPVHVKVLLYRARHNMARQIRRSDAAQQVCAGRDERILPESAGA